MCSSADATLPPSPSALTIRQPFASGIVRGQKLVENRSYRVRPRTWLAVHAGAELSPDEPLVRCLRAAWRDMPEVGLLPRSAVLGFMRVDEILEHSVEQPHPRLAEDPQAIGPLCWVIGAVLELPEPIFGVAGRLGVWTWTPPSNVTLPLNVYWVSLIQRSVPGSGNNSECTFQVCSFNAQSVKITAELYVLKNTVALGVA